MIARPQKPQDIFVEGWGRMGGYWGISRVMAEIYALLYLTPRPLTLEDMSEKLKTSRSNISLNVRGLIILGVVHKVVIRGERKDHYTAETNVGKVAKLLAMAKKKKELEPAVEIVANALDAASSVKADDDTSPDDREFYVERLEELKRHMDFVNTIFQTFVGDETGTPGDLAELQKLKESTNG